MSDENAGAYAKAGKAVGQSEGFDDGVAYCVRVVRFEARGRSALVRDILLDIAGVLERYEPVPDDAA